MNKTIKPNLIILIFSLLLGIFMAGQLKQNIPILAPVTLRSIQTSKNEINSVKEEIEDLKSLTFKRNEQLKILESIASGDENIINILNEELKNSKIAAG